MRAKKEAGFSLIELVIAMIVLSIAVATLLSVQADVLRSTVLPETLNVAAHLAEQEMERVTQKRFSQITNEGPTAYTGAFSNYTYQITVSAVPVALAVDPGMANYKQVQISVTPSGFSAVSLTTIVSNHA